MLEPPVMRRPVPGTDLLLELEGIIRDATWAGETPISLNEVKRRMHQKAPKHQQVADLVKLLSYLGRVSKTESGVEYAYLPASAAKAIRHVPL